MRLGKIKCAAKALACVSACSSFNFAKGWHFVCRFTVRLLSVVSSFRLAYNLFILEVFYQKTSSYCKYKMVLGSSFRYDFIFNLSKAMPTLRCIS